MPPPSNAVTASGAPIPSPKLTNFVGYALHYTHLLPSITYICFSTSRLASQLPEGHQAIDSSISTFMIASKVICDDTYSNKSWCIVSQGMFSLICGYLDWQLNIPMLNWSSSQTTMGSKPPYYTLVNPGKKGDIGKCHERWLITITSPLTIYVLCDEDALISRDTSTSSNMVQFIVDSGTSAHMYPHHSYFSSYQKINPPKHIWVAVMVHMHQTFSNHLWPLSDHSYLICVLPHQPLQKVNLCKYPPVGRMEILSNDGLCL